VVQDKIQKENMKDVGTLFKPEMAPHCTLRLRRYKYLAAVCISIKGVPGIQAMTRGRGGGWVHGALKKIFQEVSGHISCILVYLKTGLSHLE